MVCIHNFFYKKVEKMFYKNNLKKTSTILKALLVITPVVTLGSDYNGNILSPSKIVFNNNSSNSYIQNAMQKTVNFDGLIDQTFGNLGSMYLDSIAPDSNTDRCYSIALQADGKIVMGGETEDSNENNHFAAARLNADGSPDLSFGTNGSMYLDTIINNDEDAECHSIAIQSDGKIVMGGYAQDSNNEDHFAAARLINPMTLQSYQTSYAAVGAGIYS